MTLSLVSVLAYAPSIHAETYHYGLDVGVGESDNVTLVPTAKVHQTLGLADINFDLSEQRRLFDVQAKGDFTYLNFLQGAYRNELIGRFDGLAQYVVVPDKLTWVLQDDFGQAQLNPFAPVTPENRENVNYVATGPDIALRLGTTDFVTVSARYARTGYAVSPFNSNRFIGTTALNLPLSALSVFSLDLSSERVLFDNTVVNTDFNRTSLYAHYALQGARTQISANLGATEILEDAGKNRGPLVKLKISHQASAATTWAFTAGRDITDAATGFSGLQSGATGTLGTTVAAVTTKNYNVTYATAGWDYVRSRTTFGVSGNWEKDDYFDQPLLNVTRETAEFKIERKLSREITVDLVGRVYRSAYGFQNFAETDGLIGTSVAFRRGRGLEFKLQVARNSRTVVGVGNGYMENRIFLTVGYTSQSSEAFRTVPGRVGRPGTVANP